MDFEVLHGGRHDSCVASSIVAVARIVGNICVGQYIIFTSEL
jgi:hypothetical protein